MDVSYQDLVNLSDKVGPVVIEELIHALSVDNLSALSSDAVDALREAGFSGFSDDKKIAKHKKQLFDLLDKNAISFKGQWSFLGYNPPFELINRRNEVVVELEDYKQRS